MLTFNHFYSISKGKPIPEYKTERSALLVIDIQEGTTGRASISEGLIHQSSSFIQSVNRVIQKANCLQMPIAYVYHENTHWLLNLISRGVLAKGSPGTAIDKRITVITNNIFSKIKMDSFSNPNLDAFLRNHEINHLYITGLDAAYCVDRTSRASLKRGYHVTVIRDAVISETESKRKEMFQKYKGYGIRLISFKNL
jgi:nicotinamidase-related amidase